MAQRYLKTGFMMTMKFLCVKIILLFPAIHLSAGLLYAQQNVENNINTTYYDDGDVKEEETLKDSKREGVFKSYYAGGQVKSVGYYRAGKRDGLFKKFYENGQLMFKAQYRAGAIEGNIEMFDVEGDLVRKWDAKERQDVPIKSLPSLRGRIFDEGDEDAVFDLQKEYYKDGTLKAEKFYKNSKLEGVQKKYDKDGNLRMTLTYQDGKLVHQEGADARGEFSFGTPSDLVECFSVLQKMLTEHEIQQVKRAAPEELRDNKFFLKNKVWSLWTDTPLTDYFRDLGIYHPDDMGSIVFLTFQKYLNNEEMQLDKHIEYFQNYWQKMADDEYLRKEVSSNK
ncbi:MAG: toxin-antitoxin system YwqK family antitoxin [Candidatus Omnitrophica bacterium]|nr:toxin-antitoxin system YwqK family antitoxin [Candidatus Omnitrophota bacterium]